MIQQDRDRLIVSLFLAVVVHVVIFVGLSFVHWQIRDYPETTAVFVELMDYESTPPVPEPVAPEPEPPEPEPQIQPVEPEPQPQPQVTERAPDRPAAQPPASAPAQQPAATQSTPPVSTDAPPGSFTTEDLPWLSSPDTTTDREDSRTSDANIFRFNDETSDTGELPAWVAEGTLQPLETLDTATRESLEAKNQEIPGFQERLDAIANSLAQGPPGPGTSTSGSETSTTTTSGPPGVGPIEWVGGGTRTFLGTQAMPSLTSDDFGGLVPARITYIMVFDVNADGLVVPGSLIFRQSSGYTAADQKVRRAVSSWRFDPAPGSPPVTAICTLVFERDDIRR
jgi:outer membrane biosynthesis protein TonB